MLNMPAIDSVFLDMDDTIGLFGESSDAAASGFRYKACIHPEQVPFVREAFAPRKQTFEWAERLLAKANRLSGTCERRSRRPPAPRTWRWAATRGAAQ